MRTLFFVVLLGCLTFPAQALRLSCPTDFSDMDSIPLLLDTSDIQEVSPAWHSALRTLMQQQVVLPHRQWFLPKSLLKNFSQESFSIAWDHSKAFAPAHIYLQLLLAMATILEEEHGASLASVFLASVLTRPLEFRRDAGDEPAADDLFTAGLGSVWNYMAVFAALYNANPGTSRHEAAFHKLQTKWLNAFRDQLNHQAAEPYPLVLMTQFVPTWFHLRHGRHCSVKTQPLPLPGAYELTLRLEGGPFYLKCGKQKTALDDTLKAHIFPEGPPLGAHEMALLLRMDHLQADAHLDNSRVAYYLELGGHDIGVGLRVRANTRHRFLELIDAYLHATGLLPQRLPE